MCYSLLALQLNNRLASQLTGGPQQPHVPKAVLVLDFVECHHK